MYVPGLAEDTEDGNFIVHGSQNCQAADFVIDIAERERRRCALSLISDTTTQIQCIRLTANEFFTFYTIGRRSDRMK